jgi:hypothetical protein
VRSIECIEDNLEHRQIVILVKKDICFMRQDSRIEKDNFRSKSKRKVGIYECHVLLCDGGSMVIL